MLIRTLSAFASGKLYSSLAMRAKPPFPGPTSTQVAVNTCAHFLSYPEEDEEHEGIMGDIDPSGMLPLFNSTSRLYNKRFERYPVGKQFNAPAPVAKTLDGGLLYKSPQLDAEEYTTLRSGQPHQVPSAVGEGFNKFVEYCGSGIAFYLMFVSDGLEMANNAYGTDGGDYQPGIDRSSGALRALAGFMNLAVGNSPKKQSIVWRASFPENGLPTLEPIKVQGAKLWISVDIGFDIQVGGTTENPFGSWCFPVSFVLGVGHQKRAVHSTELRAFDPLNDHSSSSSYETPDYPY